MNTLAMAATAQISATTTSEQKYTLRNMRQASGVDYSILANGQKDDRPFLIITNGDGTETTGAVSERLAAEIVANKWHISDGGSLYIADMVSNADGSVVPVIFRRAVRRCVIDA